VDRRVLSRPGDDRTGRCSTGNCGTSRTEHPDQPTYAIIDLDPGFANRPGGSADPGRPVGAAVPELVSWKWNDGVLIQPGLDDER
jgi:hypothetical protein